MSKLICSLLTFSRGVVHLVQEQIESIISSSQWANCFSPLLTLTSLEIGWSLQLVW